ncbi:MAG: hypothetical protein AAF702_23495 [Chloroflexota bacterium]
MKLSHQDAALFYELMWGLQYFVKERLQMLPEITSVKAYGNCPAEEKLPVRQQLFEQRELIDAYVEENPQQLTEEQLAIVQSWKEAVVGDFYIERMLKRHTIFIATDDSVYGVLGLVDDFDEMFHKSRLPALIKTILLPFRGQIIYDGLMQGYNMFFGGGIKGNLKEIYMSAKQNGYIIESLDGEQVSRKQPPPSQPLADWGPELDALAASAKKLRGGSGQPAINSPAFSLIKASIEFGQLAAVDAQDEEALWKSFQKIERSVRKLETTLYRMG